jgi:hypothetical protein
MLCGIFGQDINVPKAYKFLMDEPGGFKTPKTYKELRSALHGLTFHYWRLNRKNMTPQWPRGAVAFIDAAVEQFLSRFTLPIGQAFKMMYGIGCERVPKHLLSEKVGASKEGLYTNLARIHDIAESKLEALLPFARLREPSELISVIEQCRDAKLQAEIDRLRILEQSTLDDVALVGQPNLRAETIERFSYAGVETVGAILKIPAKEIRMIIGEAGVDDVEKFLIPLRTIF